MVESSLIQKKYYTHENFINIFISDVVLFHINNVKIYITLNNPAWFINL